MQAQQTPPPPPPLRIPSEDNLPLFDPSGLSASLSAEDWNSSLDLSSVAAARLGLATPSSRNASPAASSKRSPYFPSPATTSSIKGTDLTSSLGHAGTANEKGSSSTEAAAEGDAANRGRRRRSSVLEDGHTGSNTDGRLKERGPQSSVGSKVRMWWQRGATSSDEEDGAPLQEVDGVSADFGTQDAALQASSMETVNRGLVPALEGGTQGSGQIVVASSSCTSEEGAKETDRSEVGDANRPQPRLTTANLTHRALAASPAARDASPYGSLSPTGRSPAADFLSAFSSLHSVVSPSPGSVEARSLSYSPPRLNQRDEGGISAGRRIASSPIDGGGVSWHGLGDAAAQLYGTDSRRSVADTGPLRPDDEGARFGPNQRYKLGRTIGFGGFSTVREGWDLEAGSLTAAPASASTARLTAASGEIPEPAVVRRVAVKIIYARDRENPADKLQAQRSQELAIWRSLPSHLHLLPLLYSDTISLGAPAGSPSGPFNNDGSSGNSGSSSAELLVMPYCDRGNLLDFVRSEGGLRPTSFPSTGVRTRPPSEVVGTLQASSLSRSASLTASLNGVEDGRSVDSHRTGSGFLHRHRRMGLGRVSSASGSTTLPWTLNPSQLQFSSAASIGSSPSSVVGSVSSGSGLLRRMSSQTNRSRGIPIEAARETMRQLSSALFTLHTQARVLHSDLKLENVLGQGGHRDHSAQGVDAPGLDEDTTEDSSSSASGAAPGLACSSNLSSSVLLDAGALEAMPCWRIADFGLARRISSDEPLRKGADTLKLALLDAASGTKPPPSSSHSRGGSLAYTAPEFLRARASASGTETPGSRSETDAGVSPFAADMWALGCILYALLSGRLPFSDSFEPRLQMKIAKAHWEIPWRLRRRAERLADAAAPKGTTAAARHARESSGGSFSNLESAGAPSRGVLLLREERHASPLGRVRAATSGLGGIDLSASLPSLPARDGVARPADPFEAPTMGPSPTDHVVGSAPGRAHHVDTLEVNMRAKARADAEVDPESDNDEEVEAAWDGLSWDRAAAREVLHGLLEPDPSRRWTVERLCASAWIRDDGAKAIADEATPASASGLQNADGTAWRRGASEKPLQAASVATLDFKRRKSPSRERSVPDEGVREVSTLARSRPDGLALSSMASTPASPALATPRSGGYDDGRNRIDSRSLSRGSLRDSSETRARGSGASESSTPIRSEAWGAASQLAQGLHAPMDVVHWSTVSRCDSPADSERRGRQTRSRMADLDENMTWSAEHDQIAVGRRSDWTTGRAAVPIPIRSQSQSRSRSRHSRDSSSPERSSSGQRRSRSRPRPLLPGSFDTGGGALMRGRSIENVGVAGGGAIKTDRTQVHRSSTSRSRSRAPDALAQILGRDRATSRSRGTADEGEAASAGRSTSSLNLTVGNGTPTKEEGVERERSWRGRARDRG